MRKHWRIWSSVLLGAALVAQVPGAVTLSEQFGYLDEMTLGYQAALVLFFGALSLTFVALALAVLDQRIPALVLAAVALGASLVTVPVYMTSDLANGYSLSESFRGEVLGLFTNPETGETTFWPGTFVAGIPTWLLLTSAVIVLALGRTSVPDDPWLAAGTADDASAYANHSTSTSERTTPAPTSAPPGWYADPAGGPAAYWDGQQWSRPE